MPPDPRFYLGVKHFNAEEFFEAHEAWEDYWLEFRGDERRFYQGLIQAAVSCHHWGHRNWSGGESLYRTATEKLAPYRPACETLDLDRFLADFAGWHDRAFTEAGKADPATAGEFPRIHLLEQPPPGVETYQLPDKRE